MRTVFAFCVLSIRFFYALFKYTTHICGLVIEVAVIEHGTKVTDTFLGTCVDILFEFHLYGTHVHWVLDDREVILLEEREREGVEGEKMGTQSEDRR